MVTLQYGDVPDSDDLPAVSLPQIDSPHEPLRLTITPGFDYTDPLFHQAVQQQESGNNPDAVSSKGAVGLMQTLPTTLKDPGYGVTPAKDDSKEEQARVGHDYLVAMGKKYNDPKLALMAYNWGPANVDDWIENGKPASAVPSETQNYVDKITSNYKKLKGESEVASNDPTFVPSSKPSLDEYDLPDRKTVQVSSQNQTPSLNDYDIPGRVSTSSQGDGSKNEKPKYGSGVVDTLKDVAESAGTGFVQGVDSLPKVPGQLYTLAKGLGAQAAQIAVNPLLRGMGYGLTSEEQQQGVKDSENNDHDYLGNALSKAPNLSQIPALLANIGSDNNLNYNDIISADNPIYENTLHKPSTQVGDIAATVGSGLSTGTAGGLRAIPAIGGAIGGQVAEHLAPNNPLAQVVGMGAGASAIPALRAKLSASSPENIAHNYIQSRAKVDPNSINVKELVPGSKPTLSEATNNANLALDERQIDNTNRKIRSDKETENEDVRKQYFDNAAGTPQDIQALKQQRWTSTEALYQNASKQPLDVKAIEPVIKKLDQQIEHYGDTDLATELQKIKTKIVNNLPKTVEQNKGLKDSTGKPITTSVQKNTTQTPLIQAYREIRDGLEKNKYQEGALAPSVKSVIKPIVSDLGKAIESQSPDFAAAQKVYRDISPQIDAMEWMQGLKLTDAKKDFTLAKVKRALENAKALQNSGDLKLSRQQQETLQNLYDDLQRRDAVEDSGKTSGSPTIQNAVATNAMNSGMTGLVNKLTGGKLAPAIGASGGALLHGPIGAFIGDRLGNSINKIASAKAAKATENYENFMMNPEEYKKYLVNQLNNSFSDRFKKNTLIRP